MTVYGKVFLNKKDKIREIEFTISSKEKAKHRKQIAIDRCASDHEQAVGLEEGIKELDEEISQLYEKINEVENLLKEEQAGKKQNLSEEERENKEEKQKKEQQRSEEIKKQEKEQYYSSFHGFNELYKEVQDFNESKDIQEEIDDISENILAKSLLQDENLVNSRLKTTILYVATFFPKLSSLDFERIILFLLKEQKVSIAITSKTTDEKGEIQLIESLQEKDLSYVWQDSLNQRDQILGECYLKAVRSEDSLKIIDFHFHYIKEDLKIHFEEKYPLYLEENFKRSKLLLFDSASKVAINAMDLSVEMAISNPDAYGQKWLSSVMEYLKILDLTDDLAERKELNLTSNQWLEFLMMKLEVEQQEELKLLNKFLTTVSKKQRKQFIFSRLSVFISQMLAYTQLKNEIESFLDWAIREQFQYAVLEIIKPLQNIQNFNQLYWIKQLLDRGNEEIREKAYIFLSSRLEQSTNFIYARLEYVKNWLPDPERLFSRYSPSNEYALRLLFEYAFEKISDLESKDYGDYPSKYPLFEPLNGSSDDDSKLRLLVDWIFNPGLQYIINPDITIIQVTSSLISDWFSILWGLGNKEAKPESAKIIDNLIKQIKIIADRNQQKDLIQSWNDMSEDLLNKAESASEAGDEQLRKLLIQKRNAIRQLKQQFKNS